MNPTFRLLFPITLIVAGIGALFTLTRKESKEKPSGALPAPAISPVAAPPAVAEPAPAEVKQQEPQS